MTHEGARHLDDVLARRTRISIETYDRGTETAELAADLMAGPLGWDDEITETPGVGDVEIWEIHNLTMDAHPIHVHLVQFEVLGRGMGDEWRDPEPNETGPKDTVIAYPDEVTRIRARFDKPGLFVWHCHILEHEDHEMMRPFRVTDN